MATRKYPSVVSFARDFEQLVKRRATSLDVFLDLAAKELVSQTRQLMSGSLKKRDLRRLKHPYARRHVAGTGTAIAPLLPINVQSGKLRSSVHAVISRTTTQRSITVLAPTFYFPYLALGTRKMVARPIREEMTKRARAVAKTLERWHAGKLS